MQVRDVLTFGGLSSATVVAGTAGLNKQIESISVLEIAEESISTWTLQNQMFITSFYAIRDDLKMQKIVIETLSQCGCCGLVICHLKYVLQTIHPSVLELCDRLRFPLIVADTNTSFVDIINPIFSRLSQPTQTAEHTMIRSDFIDLLTSDMPLSESLKVLAYAVGYSISFLDINLSYLYSNKGDIQKEREAAFLKETLGWRAMDIRNLHYHIMERPGGNPPTMIYFVKKGGNLFGFLCIDFKPDDTEEQVLAVADSLNLPCALLINKTRKMSHLEADYLQTFFSDLLVWNFRSNDGALRRAEDLGIALTAFKRVMVVNLNAFQGDKKQDRELVNYIQRWYLPNVEQIVRSYSPDNVLHFRSDIFLILVAQPLQSQQLREMGDRILQLFTASKITSVSIGISTPMEQFTEIPRAYNEAFDLAILGRSLLGVNRVTDFSELGIFYHLRNARTVPSVLQIQREIIAPLQNYDESKNTELVKTAWTLFRCNLDVQRSADTLHVHRNTLLYRKKQIQDIMGYNAFELPYCFNFMAALFIAAQE